VIALFLPGICLLYINFQPLAKRKAKRIMESSFISMERLSLVTGKMDRTIIKKLEKSPIFSLMGILLLILFVAVTAICIFGEIEVLLEKLS